MRGVGRLLMIGLVPAAVLAGDLPLVETFGPGAAERWNVFAGEWKFQEGFAVQASSDYDCGAATKVAPAGPYFVAATFKPLSAFNGAGLFFGLPEVTKKHGGMLVRCDPGGRVLWGWFNADGAFEFQGEAQCEDAGQKTQVLGVAVDPARLAFNIYHNGERVATNIKTYQTTGFVGIQSSGGPHEFRKVEVREATEAELAGLTAPGPYSRGIDVIGNRTGLLMLRRAPEFLTAYDEGGDALRRVNVQDVKGLTGGELRPVALCWDLHDSWSSAPGVYVLAEDGAAIYRFNPLLRQIGAGPLVRDTAMRGLGIAVGPEGHIFVADAALPGVRVFAEDGTQRLAFGTKGDVAIYAEPTAEAADRFKAPRGIAVSPRGEIVVTDRENYTYKVFRYDAERNALEWLLTGPWLPYPGAVRFDHEGNLLLAGTYEFYRAHGALRVMTLDGRGQRVFVGHTLGDMSDKVRACEGPGGNYHVMDPDKERVLILPPDFVEPLPRFEWTADRGVRMTITAVDGKPIETTTQERTADGQRIVVRQHEPVCKSWPRLAPADLRSYEIPAPPPAGKTYVIDLPVLVAVFTKMTDEQGQRVEIDGTGIIERMQRELERDRMFYWRNSWCVLNKQFEFMLIDEIEPQNVGAWIVPSEGRRLVNGVRKLRDLEPVDAHHSLVVIHPRAGFDPNDTEDVGFVSGGGLTTTAYSGYTLWNHGQGWLMGHEWGHQLDSYFDLSGMTDWWLNHPDGTVHLGRYGEHWDCNAFLCRRADRMNWLRLKFGTLRLVDDADGDTLPDADPSVPMDEARFGSDPAKADTDGDGLSDLHEFTASTFSSTDPRAADSDGDGTPDTDDPYPTHAVATELRRVERLDTGELRLGPRERLGAIERPWGAGVVFGGYDADHVYFYTEIVEPFTQFHVTVDFDDDGWFIGRDNVYATATLDWSDPDAVKVQRTHNCTASVWNPAGGTALQVAVPRPERRPPLAPGGRIGVTVRFQDGGGTIAFLIDPWQILGLTLR